MLSLASLSEEIRSPAPTRAEGRVIAVRGPVVSARVPTAAIGDLCLIELRRGSAIRAQIVGFENDLVTLAPFEGTEGLTPGALVKTTGGAPRISVSDALLGKILDAEGNEIGTLNGAPRALSPTPTEFRPIFAPPPPALERQTINKGISTGVRSLDALLPLGYGQRIGLFAGAGVGKSTLLGMIARNATVDVAVVALVGERGREVREFLDESLGSIGAHGCIVVVATSDESSAKRCLAPYTATAIAEYFRERGLNVLLLVDSLTRMARARREVGLAAGELPVRQGYTASVFTELPRLLERAGTARVGSITAFYTVLTNGDDTHDVLGEEVKSILDGHITLADKVARQGIRPAIDHAASVSRVANSLTNTREQADIALIRRVLYRLERDRDIVLLGGVPDRELEVALKFERRLSEFLTQRPSTLVSTGDTMLERELLAEDLRLAIELTLA